MAVFNKFLTEGWARNVLSVFLDGGLDAGGGWLLSWVLSAVPPLVLMKLALPGSNLILCTAKTYSTPLPCPALFSPAHPHFPNLNPACSHA